MAELIGNGVLALLAVFGCGYAAIVAALTLAIGRVRTGASEECPTVTVVVAARNEEAHIAACLDALRAQHYPSDRYAVIVVNDRSTDATGMVLASYAGAWDALTVITIDHVPDGMSPKKHALGVAIDRAQSVIVLQTDADCVVPPSWVSGMVRRFEPGIDMVAGVAPYRPAKGLVARFVAHEYIWNVLLSAGSIVLGAGTHASGRNMAFRRAAFLTMDGYGPARAILSGDDTLLMQRFQHRQAGSVATNPSPATHVLTDPPQSLATFVRQRIRHMSTGRYFHPFQIAAGVVVYGFHAAMIASFALMPVAPWLGIAAMCAFVTKAACDAIAFGYAGRVCSLAVNWRFFLTGELLGSLYFSLFPLLGAMLPVTWKENR